MDSVNNFVYVATLGKTREQRLWNDIKQIEPVLKDLEEQKDKITELHLSENSLSISVAEELATKIQDLKNLQIAGFNDIFVSRLKTDIPKSLSALVHSLEGKNIRVLNLSDNAFGPIGASAIDFYLEKTSTLKEFYLVNNGLGPEGADQLATAFCKNDNIKLERIRIGRNRLESKGATAFGKFFAKCDSLLEVAVFQNGIKDDGMSNLVKGLHRNTGLQVLRLNDNYIGDDSAEQLIDLLEQTQNLSIIDISDSNLGCENSISVFEKLSKINSLSEIYSNYNEIEEKDAQNQIVEILSKRESKFNKLELKGNEINKSVFKKIKTNKILDEAECYSESEMDVDELDDLMSELNIKK
jgi:Ran GTPase-activating protein 1